MRHTGIHIIGDVPWGTHFCQFYQDKQDLIDILVPYFKAGLENNEFCMWITSEPLRAQEAQAALAGKSRTSKTTSATGRSRSWTTASGTPLAEDSNPIACSRVGSTSWTRR